MQGHVLFNEVGSRFEAHNQLFQYRRVESDEMIKLKEIALLSYEDGETVSIRFTNNESIDSVYPGGCMFVLFNQI